MLLAYILISLCLADLAAYFYLFTKKSKPQAVIVNVPLIRKQLTFRKAVLSLVMRHYMSSDANLGYRMKANTKPFRLLHRLPGRKKRFKEVNIKNFFEIRTDNYGFISNTPEQQRDYAALAEDDTIYKILICGNSVTTGYGVRSSEFNWPAVLETSLNAHKELLPAGYREVAIINSSALGSTPAQELRRFQDETIFLNPDLVLLFSAGAMEYDYQGNPIDIGLHEQQKAMNEVFNRPWYVRHRYLLPNLFECIDRQLQPTTKTIDAFPYRKEGYLKVSAAQHVLSKVQQFKGICDAHDIDFAFLLQPAMGVGQKNLTKQERGLIKHFERYFFGKNWEEYLRIFQAYLQELRPQLTVSYQYDMVDVFHDITETVYCDPRHQNEHGHAILAQKIEEIVQARWRNKSGQNTPLQAAA